MISIPFTSSEIVLMVTALITFPCTCNEPGCSTEVIQQTVL